MFKQIRKPFAFTVVAILLSGSLSGCISLLLGGGDSPPRYTLEPVRYDASSSTSMQEGRLIIADPKAEAAFDTAQIALSVQPLRFDYYSKGEWADRAPRLLGIFLERSFENNGTIETVGDRTTVPVGDFILQTDIRAFHIDRSGDQKIARISYYARLHDRRNRSLARKLFKYEQPVDGKSLSDAVDALNVAANRAGRDTVTWALENMQGQEIVRPGEKKGPAKLKPRPKG